MTWTADSLLSLVQELLGETAGDFYNISNRIALLNVGQNELIRDSRALVSSVEIPITGDDSYDVPARFVTFGQIAPEYVSLDGTRHRIQVVDPMDLYSFEPGWRNPNSSYYGVVPKYLYLEGGKLYLVPNPPSGGELFLSYVYLPNPMVMLDDQPFDGVAELQQYAPALAYFAANALTMAKNLNQANVLYAIYAKMKATMISDHLRNPQREIFLRPRGYRMPKVVER